MAKVQSSLFRGALYALATAALLATQAPLSLLGAKRLSAAEFICVTEMVLLLCVPFMLRTRRSREQVPSRFMLELIGVSRRHEAIRSCGEVNDLIVWFLGKGLPSVDLAHGDLS